MYVCMQPDRPRADQRTAHPLPVGICMYACMHACIYVYAQPWPVVERYGQRACGRVGVWACGRVGVWACGRECACVHVCTCTRMHVYVYLAGEEVEDSREKKQLCCNQKVRPCVERVQQHKVGGHGAEGTASGDVARGAEGEASMQVVDTGALAEDGEEDLAQVKRGSRE